jgi:hypothetical protein
LPAHFPLPRNPRLLATATAISSHWCAVVEEEEAAEEVTEADDALAYCMSRFRTYDPSTGTYIGYDGRAHACP